MNWGAEDELGTLGLLKGCLNGLTWNPLVGYNWMDIVGSLRRKQNWGEKGQGIYKYKDGLISWDRRVRSLHILGSWGKGKPREMGFHQIPNQYFKYHLKKGCYWSQHLTLRGVWKFRWLGQAGTWALLQKYICYIYVPSTFRDWAPV